MNYALQNISPGLIHSAQLGNKDSINRLAEAAKVRLSAYIYRLTLDPELAQDILQETLLFMIQSIDQLENVNSFWYWLFRTALGKVQHHYRSLKKRRFDDLSEFEKESIHERISGKFEDGLTEMLRKELSDAVFKAMKKLKFKYRNVLVLRCFENMPYSEIAAVLNCSEIQSRVLFFRAKNSLKRHLAVQGYGRRYFLVALALFGIVTATAKTASASTAVTAASLETGFAAGLIAALSSKIGLTATGFIAALALAVPVKSFVNILAAASCIILFIFLLAVADLFSR
jgi:RNA polymerase sigma-70 factor (ECF subfamily)